MYIVLIYPSDLEGDCERGTRAGFSYSCLFFLVRCVPVLFPEVLAAVDPLPVLICIVNSG